MDKKNDTEKAELEKVIIKETQEEFSNRVEEYVWMADVSYLDAVVALMQSSDYEEQHTAKLITPALKALIEAELKDVNLLRKINKKKT